MKIKIKKLNKSAVIPKYARDGDAGMDLVAVNNGEIMNSRVRKYNTGLAIEIPKGYVGLIFPRSSVYKMKGRVSNSVGVIDSGYRGEISVMFDKEYFKRCSEMEGEQEPTYYKKGDKIAQLIVIPYPYVEFTEVDELSETERGEGGYGSTD